MEKNYCLKINDGNLYFRSLESIKKFFIECGVKKRLELEGEEYVELDNLEYLIGEGEVDIFNECMCERGDDYCSIELEEFDFED